MSDKLLKYYQEFSLETVSEAPNATGLYAWYASLNAGPKDWEMQIVDSEDKGIERLRNILRKQTDRFGFRTLETKAIGPFSQTWTGQLNDQTSNVLKDILSSSNDTQNQDSNNEKGAPKLQASLESPDSRYLLVKALESASPFLSSPIYIGVAENLNSRLSDHARDIKKLTSKVAKDPGARDTLKKLSKKSFAIRAVVSGFSPANLLVWTFNLDSLAEDLEIDTQEHRTVAEAAEWILNRWNRPYLGVR